MTETPFYCYPVLLTFLLSLLRTHCSPIIRRSIVAADHFLIVLVTYCPGDFIVLVTLIVRVTLLFSVSI